MATYWIEILLDYERDRSRIDSVEWRCFRTFQSAVLEPRRHRANAAKWRINVFAFLLDFFYLYLFFLWLRVDALFVPSSGHPSVRPGRWRFPSLHRDLLFGLTRYRRKKTHLPAVINQVVSSFIQRLIGFCQGCTQFRSCTAASWWVQFDSIYHTIFRFDPVNNKFLVLHLFFT